MLELDIPAMLDLPAGDEVVIIGGDGSELAKEEHFVGESPEEFRILEDLCAVDRGTARKNEHGPVESISGREFEVVSLKVRTAPEIEDTAHTIPRTRTANNLIGTETTDLSIFKRRTDCIQEVDAWPVYMIVHEDGECCVDLWNGMADLQALVSNVDGGNRDGGRRPALTKGLNHLLNQFDLGFTHCDDEDRPWLIL